MMKHVLSYRVLGVVVLLSLLLSLSPSQLSQARQVSSLTATPTADPMPGASIRINEVMPKPEAGDFEWVELYNPRTFLVYLPLVLRNGNGEGGSARLAWSPQPRSETPDVPLDISGWQITDEDGNTYTIPEALPGVPPEAYVLIVFDGLGPTGDDYDFSDGLAVLHSSAGMVDILVDEADQVALYLSNTHSPDTIIDFMAWGEPPGDDAANAAAAGLWDESWYASFQKGFGDITQEDLLIANESLGRYPASSAAGPQGFALYQASQLTPGDANPVPEPTFYTPEYGAIVETMSFSVGWSLVPGATGYAFQLDENPAFSSPVYDTTVAETYFKPPSPLSSGTYYWRIRALGGLGEEGPWLGPIETGIVEFPASRVAGSGVEQEVILDITPVRQNKDSRLLCLDGDPEGNPDSNDPENAWDSPAPCTVPPCADYTKFAHGHGYCVRASIRMMASHYGGALSMDRISYHVLQEWEGNTRPGTHDDNPNNDLGHGRGMHYPDEESEGISWALGTTITAMPGKPSFDDIKSFIDANRPIMFRRPGHMMVIDGYWEILGIGVFIHVLDPDQPPDCERWQLYITQTIDGYWPGPASAPGVRSDEASVSADTDGDGIVDFDEENRFPTGHTDADSDDDGQPDKIDMREYVFDPSGGFSYRDPDGADNDGHRKEADPDNDNGGSFDGCEDANRNGKYEPGLGETSNFDSANEGQCLYVVDGVYGRPNCTWTGVRGYVLTGDGLPEANVQMRIGNDQGWRADIWTDANGFYLFAFANSPMEGFWFVQVFKGGQVSSNQVWWRTTATCANPYDLQEVQIDWRHRQ
jgi:hypothetical protein